MRSEKRSGLLNVKDSTEASGERIVPGKTPYLILQEHVQRYVFAADRLSGCRVLDVGCGSGYGTTWLSSKNLVVGVDSSEDAIQFANDNYAGDGVQFLCASAEHLPFRNEYFDGIVSFETIEHLGDYRLFVRECSRVLCREGILICSTPNRDVVSPGNRRPSNPYHIHEFNADDLRALLLEEFHDVEIFSQSGRPLWRHMVEVTFKSGSKLVPRAARYLIRKLIDRIYPWEGFIVESPKAAEPGSFHPDPRFKVSTYVPRAAFIVAVASKPRRN